MRHNIRGLLSIPALAIAAMAISVTNVDAQCPGGCFGYPTPSQPAVRTFASAVQFQPAVHYQPAVQFQPAQQIPSQTLVQAAPLVSAPQFAPIESYAPVHSFAQTQQFVQPQFAPVMAAPIDQTFIEQPTIVTPMQRFDTPQYFPQPLGASLPANTYFPPQSGVISQGQLGEPMISNSIGEFVSPNGETADSIPDEMSSEIENDDSDKVQEGQIEGEIVSPANDSPASEMTPEKLAELDIDQPASAQENSNSLNMQGNVDDIPLTPAKELSVLEEADKAAAREAVAEAAKEKAAKEKRAAKKKANKLKAEKAKAARMEADKKKAAEMKATKKKAAKEKAKSKVETVDEKITRLENSIKRQINRAKQLSNRDLNKTLEQLKADNASEDQIATAEKEAAAALQEKIEEIQNRVQGRIDQLKE